MRSLLLLLVALSSSRAQNNIPAEIILRPEPNITADYDSSISISCAGYGSPLPTITWFRDGVVITNSTLGANIYDAVIERQGISLTRSLLDICPLQVGGNYSCEARNTNGRHAAYFEVIVLRAVSIATLSSDTNATVGDAVSLACTASGIPTPDILWSRQGISLTSRTLNVTERRFTSSINQYSLSVLHLCDLQSEDYGEYICTASNRINEGILTNASSLLLQVHGPYNITVPPQSQSVVEGDRVELTCTVSGSPLPVIKWKLVDGDRVKVINASDSMLISSTISSLEDFSVTSNLTLLNVQYSNRGVYVCSPIGLLNNDTAFATLTVFAPSSFVMIPPVDQSVTIGNSFSVACVVQGYPLPAISWSRHGQPITSETAGYNTTDAQRNATIAVSVVTLCNVESFNSGEHACTATNSLAVDSQEVGSNAVSHMFNITVLIPANITVPPMNQSVTEGDIVVLTCTVSGTPLPEVEWRFMNGNGESVITADDTTLISSTVSPQNDSITSRLTLMNIQYTSEGIYVCSATNSLGNDTASATLNIFGPSSFIMIPPVEQFVAIGNSFSVACVVQGYPLPVISWSRSGQLITSETAGYSITNVQQNATIAVSVMTLCNVEPVNFAEHACTATNSLTVDSQEVISTAITHMFNVTASVPANITVPPLSQSVTEGDRVELTCTVSGPPLPEVEWRFVDGNGERVITADSTTLISSTAIPQNRSITSRLTLMNVRYSNEGVYVCSATNTLGNDTASATLNVFGPSSFFIVPPTEQSIATGDGFSVACVVYGHPLPTIFWSRDGIPITSGARGYNITVPQVNQVTAVSVLNLCDVEAFHTGEYACIAQNSLTVDSQIVGSRVITHKFNVSILMPASITSPPRNQSAAEGDGAELMCTASGTPLPEMEWKYVDGNEERVLTANSATLISSTVSSHNASVISHLTLPRVQYSNEGVYVCSANNLLGNDTAYATLAITTTPFLSLTSIYLIGSLGGAGIFIFLGLILLSVVCCIKRRRRKTLKNKPKQKDLRDILQDKSLSELGDRRHSNNYFDLGMRTARNSFQLSVSKKLLIHANNIQLGKSIGEGEFGIVYKAILRERMDKRFNEVVAVKTLKGFCQEENASEMLKECTKMMNFNHPNILRLRGVCLDGGPAPYIITPFMSHGSLLNHLRTNRESLTVNPDSDFDSDHLSEVRKKLIDMCIQVGKGMEYLASKRLIHRDLAARNCMIDSGFVIKVSDFGLSETLDLTKDYFRPDQKEALKLPIKWLAPECISDGIFSEKTDVWAYGVTCWEVFSGGKTPYPGIHPLDLWKQLEAGTRMDKPKNAACSTEIFSIIKKCWDEESKKRPRFAELVAQLTKELGYLANYFDLGMANSAFIPTEKDDMLY